MKESLSARAGYIFIVVVGWACEPGRVEAEFELNFMPVQNPGYADFLKGGYSNTGNPFRCPDVSNPDCRIGTELSSDQTNFYYERVDGYWHLIIGDPSVDQFAQEVYIPVERLFLSDSGGHEPVFFVLNGNLEQWSGNGWDPLEFSSTPFGPENTSFSGNGSGNPTKAVIRQLVGAGTLSGDAGPVQEWSCAPGQFCQEFIKSQAGFKPKIVQSYNDATISMNFELDMSAITYDDMTTPADIINTITILEPDIPAESAFFDINTVSGDVNVTGGRYVYTPGEGWHDDGDGDGYWAYGAGSYEYADSGVSDFHTDINWSSYYDPYQNPVGSYSGNKLRCDAVNLEACNHSPAPY